MDNPKIDANGTKWWWANGQRHRTDGPAIEWADGDTEWYLYGVLHRTDGPAVEWANGDPPWWYIHGQGYLFDEWLDLNPELSDDEKLMMKLQYG
jgi:hypothetical protein